MSSRYGDGFFLEGYPDRLSYLAGETVLFMCSTNAREFACEVARVGGEREIVWERRGLEGREHAVPDSASADGCDWPESFSFRIPDSWRSGYYEVVLRAVDEASGRLVESLAFFAVRAAPGDRQGKLLLVLAANTYNAYNDWGGPSLYTGAVRASFHRPLARGFLRKPEPHVRYPNIDDVPDPEHERFRAWADLHGLARWSGSAGWYNWERPFVRWAERNGYRLDVAVNADLEIHPEVVDGYRLVLSVGHDEYWSWGMRDTLESFVEGGGNAAFFSGNAVCWQVRLEGEGQTMVCYKDRYEEDPLFGTEREHLTTTLWCSRVVGRPENHLTGVSFSRGGYIRMGTAVPRGTGGYGVWRPRHWVFEGTGLHYGDQFGTEDAIAVYEVDGCEFTLSPDGLPVPTGQDGTPTDFEILATAPARLWARDELPSRYRSAERGDLESTSLALFGSDEPEALARIAHNHAVMGVFSRGGTVFSAGTTDWAYGLAGHDPVVDRVTRNVLDRLSSDGSDA